MIKWGEEREQQLDQSDVMDPNCGRGNSNGSNRIRKMDVGPALRA